MRIAARDGRIAGTKVFHYLVMPDSAGSFLLPEVRYPYYDLAAGDYRAATIAPRALAVAPGIEPHAARALPPLSRGRDPAWADEVARGLAPWGWLVLLVGPPLLLWLRRRRALALDGPTAVAPAAPERLTQLGRLERAFHAVLASHVPDQRARDGDGLARALRAAGVDSAVADHVKRLRDRLRASRYGPRGLGDVAELAAELAQVLRVLDAEPGGKGRRVVAAIALMALAALAQPAAAQTLSAEALYDAGALRAAADSFAARAAAEPRVPPTRSRHARPPNRVCRRIGTTSAPRCTAPARTVRRWQRGPRRPAWRRVTLWYDARASCSRHPTPQARRS